MASVIVDLSSNNGHPIDYQAARDSGVFAAIIKATDGTGYVNPFYGQDAAGFEAVGVPVLAYHFAEFGDPIAEAAHFVSVAGNRARVLDSETNANVEWQNEFLDALHLPSNEVMDYGSASTLPRSGIRALLWPASYGRNYGFGDAWQFTDAQVVPGIPGLVDASVWIGPQADFDSLFSITPPAPNPPEVSVVQSPAVTFRPSQVDVFQVAGGVLYHKWQDNGGAWNNEAVAGPGGGASTVHVTVAAVAPEVAILGGACWVTVEGTDGLVYVFAQGSTGGWGAARLP